MSRDNSLMVVCGGEVVVAAVCNVTTMGDAMAAAGIVATDGVVFVVGVAAAVALWVQRCLMRPCTIPQFAFVSVVVTPTGKELSWWDR